MGFFDKIKKIGIFNGFSQLDDDFYDELEESLVMADMGADTTMEAVEELRHLAPDIMITAAYGQILTQRILDIPPMGVVNVHGSLLPKYRGPAPIQWAVIRGEKETGITTMMTARGVDSGDILLILIILLLLVEGDNMDLVITLGLLLLLGLADDRKEEKQGG